MRRRPRSGRHCTAEAEEGSDLDLERFRWLSYEEWELAGRESLLRLAIGTAELLAAMVLVVIAGRRWWCGLIVPTTLALDYGLSSATAYRRRGPVMRPRAPFRYVSYREWEQRRVRRRGFFVLAFLVLAVPLMAGDEAWLIAFVMPLVIVGDYVWCCASSGAWLASRPPPPHGAGIPAPR